MTNPAEARALVAELRLAAQQIAQAGHDGWGNTCAFGADALEASLTREARLEQALLAVSELAGTGMGNRIEAKALAALDQGLEAGAVDWDSFFAKNAQQD